MTDAVDMTKTPHIKAGSGAECTQDRTRETVEAIVAEMRAKVEDVRSNAAASMGALMMARYMDHYADRLTVANTFAAIDRAMEGEDG